MMLHKRLITLTRGVRGHIGRTVGLGLLISATYVGQGLLAAGVVARIFGGAQWSDVVPQLLLIGTLILGRAGLLWLREMSALFTAAAVKQELRGRLYSRLLELGPGYLLRTRTGAVQSSLVDGVEALEGYLGYYLPQAAVAILAPLGILIGLAALDPLVGLMIFISVLLALWGPRLWDRLLTRRGANHWEAYGTLNSQFLDSMQGMNTLKAFNASTRRGQELQRASQKLYRATMAQMAVSLLDSGIVGLATASGIGLAVAVGAIHLAEGTLTLAALLTILFLAGECLRPLAELSAYWHQGYMGISAAGGIFALLDAEVAVREPSSPVAASPATTRPTLAFEGVSFAYDDGKRPALANLSFSVAPGETVALVGRSGAGKTTVVSLLLRFFDPQAGRVTLDGRDLREYGVESLRRMLAVVAQDTYLFHGTVRENLLLADPTADQAALEAAARAANAHDFISALPQGYDTLIGERGMKLSGGERQRIAIARALLKDAPILVLDEATSSVDAANEAAIQEALEKLIAGRTTLVIAHRLSTVVNADRIVVLEGGQAVEAGPHAELLGRQGAYARLVAGQQSAA